MDGSLMFAVVSVTTVLFLVTKVQLAAPDSPWHLKMLRSTLGLGSGASESPWPRSAEYFATSLPRSWPIRRTLMVASEELQAMRQTLASAQAVRVPDTIIRSYDQNMRQAGRLINRNGDRIVQAARTGPVSPQLQDALMRKQQSLLQLLEALQAARGSLAAVIVTGLEDQRDLDRLTSSLQAWSEALGDVSLDTLGRQLPLATNEA